MSLTLPRPDVRAAEPARRRLPSWALPVVAALAGVALALTSKGFLWQDEYAHLQFSRWVWHHPSVAVDLWGRPLATLLYAIPSLAGLWAARLLTVALATAAAVWTGKAARERGLSEPVAWACVLAQPVFFHFGFGALPGTLFAALLARFLLEDARGRHGRGALLCALLPLARVEGVLVVAVYAVATFRRGERRLALAPFAGLAIWNLAGWAVTGSALFLLNANPYPMFGSIYPTAGWLYLARILPAGAGVAVLALGGAGFVASARRRALGLEHAIGVAVGAFLVAIWGFPMFASTPTPVYLIGFAPVLALYAARGWRAVSEARPRAFGLGALGCVAAALVLFPRAHPAVSALTTPIGGAERLAFGAALCALTFGLLLSARFRKFAAVAFVLAGLLQVSAAARPVPQAAHERVAAEAAAYYRAHLSGRPVVGVAPDFAWDAHADPFVGWRPGALPTDAGVGAHAAAPNAIYAWDSEYSVREGRTSLGALHAGGWRDLATFSGGGVEMRLLERAGY